MVRCRAPAALWAVLDSTVFLEESEGGLLPQSLCRGKDHSFDEERLPAAAAAARVMRVRVLRVLLLLLLLLLFVHAGGCCVAIK